MDAVPPPAPDHGQTALYFLTTEHNSRTWNRWIHIGYTCAMGKDVGMRIRVERDLRDRFTGICQAEGETAAAVLRRFMRQYAAGRATPAQGDLFDQPVGNQRVRRGPERSKGRRDQDRDDYGVG